jgi:ankyrin repeat protein
VASGDTTAWQARLKSKADVNVRDGAGNTALHLAALNHDLAAVDALLAAGAEADARNSAEATPLLYGAGHAGVVRALLARGANPNAASKLKVTPLMAAVAPPESFEVARLLLEAGADVHAKRTTDVEVMLSRAVVGGERRTLELLLWHGAVRDRKSTSGALSAAAFGGDAVGFQGFINHPDSVIINSIPLYYPHLFRQYFESFLVYGRAKLFKKYLKYFE